MSDNSISIRKWLENYKNGEYSSADVSTMCDAGWYDWFCSDESLLPRLKDMYPKLEIISKSEKINLDTMYVFFKNNCPMDGKLYDDFRICDIESGDVIWTITPSVGHTKSLGISEVWGKENDFDKPLVSGNMMNIFKYFGVSESATMESIISEDFDEGDEEEELEEDYCFGCGLSEMDCICGEEDDDFDELEDEDDN